MLKWIEVGFEKFSNLGPVVYEFNKLGWVVETVMSSSHGKPKTIGAYLLVHIKTNKCYIGSHGNLYTRPYQHESLLRLKNHWINEFQDAYVDDPNLIVMFITTDTREQAFDIEQKILTKFSNTNTLFNIGDNARIPTLGLEVSEDTRILLSLAGKGRVLTQQHRDRIGNSHKGKVISEEHKQALKNALSGKKQTPERKALSLQAAMVNAKKLVINGCICISLAEAGRNFNIASSTVTKRLNSKHFPSWHYASDILEKPISIKGIVYDSIDAYSKLRNLNIDIIKLRIDNRDNDLYAEWKYV